MSTCVRAISLGVTLEILPVALKKLSATRSIELDVDDETPVFFSIEAANKGGWGVGVWC